jgi:uncharacterized membrane protein YjgN (DUF898 family)
LIPPYSPQPGPDSPIAAATQRVKLSHDGEVYDLLGIYFVNMLLTIVTLGIYRFWAKTRIRRYLWSHTEFLEDRFEYTGTGKELLIGFLIVLAILAVTVGAYTLIFTSIWPGWASDIELGILYQLPLFIASFPLVAIARFRARRYRLSRTLWRGIRGSQSGSSSHYGVLSAGCWLLTFFTLGFYWPYMQTRLVSYRLNHTWFGDRAVTFDGNGDDLIGYYAVCWLLTLPTLGMCWFWYRARSLQYYASRTAYATLGFKVTITGGTLINLISTNLILIWFSFGLAYPFVLRRNASYLCTYLSLVGDQDFALIVQSLKLRPTTGEGMAEAFDIGDF